MFISHPYKCTKEFDCARSLCCVNGKLPQGAPTSPIISNMLCARLDAHMNRLAVVISSALTQDMLRLNTLNISEKFPKELAESEW